MKTYTLLSQNCYIYLRVEYVNSYYSSFVKQKTYNSINNLIKASWTETFIDSENKTKKPSAFCKIVSVLFIT